MDENEKGAPAIDYAGLMQAALLGVVRAALSRAAAAGLPGDHHFYLTFGTAEEGVELPARVRRQHPDEITIVLQHQYWNLATDEHGFSVTLRFGGAPERVVVPWTALRAFVDPSVGFGLRLRPETDQGSAADDDADAPGTSAPAAPGPLSSGAREPAAGPAAAQEAKVVDFGAFRRRTEAEDDEPGS